MLSLQFILTLIATICEEEYFNRNLKVQAYVQLQFEEFMDASSVDSGLIAVLKFIDKLKFDSSSYWFNKANIFTLIVELYNYDLKAIQIDKLKIALERLEEDNTKYLIALKQKTGPKISKEHEKYIESSREGVNGKPARDYRGKVINKMIKRCLD